MFPLKITIEPIRNGYIIECRDHQGRELTHAPDEETARDEVTRACETWRAAAEAERARTGGA